MSNRIKMEGTQSGYWEVLEFVGVNKNRQSAYRCRCICGTEREVVAQALREKKTVSCGCKKGEVTSNKLFKHGRNNRSANWSPEYRAWMSMRRRVSPGTTKMRILYADRGITVCPEWDRSFDAFLADMGKIPHPGLTLDRIENDLGYTPGNCRWTDCQTQSQNRRQNQGRRKAAA